MILLAADIGGTTSRFCWRDTTAAAPAVTCCYPSRRFSSFIDLLKTVIADQKLVRIDYACFGLPGPVIDAEVNLTNLPWRICACDLERQLPIGQVELVNDFQVAAYGVELLDAGQVQLLHPGRCDPAGNRLVIGAGTGLGVAPVYHLGRNFYPQPSEGGHIDFAPANVVQQQLLDFLHQCHHQHITYEDILSGYGVCFIYRFCCHRSGRCLPSAPFVAADVHALACDGDEVAVEAVRLFVNIYGEFVGNAALLWPARAGIYLCGGIGLKFRRWMNSSAFVDGFLNRDKMRPVVEQMPVYLVLDELLGLRGALLLAQRRAAVEGVFTLN